MGLRTDLQALLLGFADNVYFQPPPSIKMSYPAIVYKWDDEQTVYADNAPYIRTRRYSVTVIDKNPDSPIPDLVGNLPQSNFSRRFESDNLNHTVYSLYF